MIIYGVIMRFSADSKIQNVVMLIGMVGACIFILIQLLCLIEFSSNWALSWEVESDGKCGDAWLCLIGMSRELASGVKFFKQQYELPQ